MPEVSYHRICEARIEAAVALATANPVRGLGRVQMQGRDILTDLDLRPLSFSDEARERRLKRRLANRKS